MMLQGMNKINGDNLPEFKQQQWDDWRWQVAHIIRDAEMVERILGVQFAQSHRQELQETIGRFPMRVTPYYLSLVDADDYRNDPIFIQAVPNRAELIVGPHDLVDPLSEDADSPAPGIIHRYPDRVLFHVSNLCAMYCRHCTRKRKVGDVDQIPSVEELQEGINYIRKTPVVRDVLLSGGDPFMLSDDLLDWLLSELQAISHVEMIRIGTRVPVVLPQRITRNLVAILKKYHPLWINTQFNHPREVTATASSKLAMLADAGIPLGNQSVLLAGVNDCPRIMKALVHKLVRNRVRPYYLYQCDLSEGLTHFRTSVGKGVEILESLIGHTSGLAVPTYVIDAPGGGGKIPIMPHYLISWSNDKVILRNYEGMITTYYEPEAYKPVRCDQNCETCRLSLRLGSAEEIKTIGIAQLLADYEENSTLIPENNERVGRRETD